MLLWCRVLPEYSLLVLLPGTNLRLADVLTQKQLQTPELMRLRWTVLLLQLHLVVMLGAESSFVVASIR